MVQQKCVLRNVPDIWSLSFGFLSIQGFANYFMQSVARSTVFHSKRQFKSRIEVLKSKYYMQDYSW